MTVLRIIEESNREADPGGAIRQSGLESPKPTTCTMPSNASPLGTCSVTGPVEVAFGTMSTRHKATEVGYGRAEQKVVRHAG
jgi:hypothetical protein